MSDFEHPGLDRLPAHQRQAFLVGPYDAEVDCIPSCPACDVLYSLRAFYEECG